MTWSRFFMTSGILLLITGNLVKDELISRLIVGAAILCFGFLFLRERDFRGAARYVLAASVFSFGLENFCYPFWRELAYILTGISILLFIIWIPLLIRFAVLEGRRKRAGAQRQHRITYEIR